jgi:hypothetical protein
MSPQRRVAKKAGEPGGKAAKLRERLETLKRSLLSVGPIAQGSILKRTIRREAPRRPGETKNYGPYYQWTRKIAGRTAIQNLTESQARKYAGAIRENRRLEQTVAEMRTVSLKFLDLTTQGVAKRKRVRKGEKGLS